MANDCEKITFYAPSDRRGGVKPIPSCEPGQLIVPEDLPIPPNPETPEPTPSVPRPLEVLSTPYTFICDNKLDRKTWSYDPATNAVVKIPTKYLSTEDVDKPGYIENYYYGSGSAVIVPKGYVTTTIPFSAVPDIASDVLDYIAVNNRELDIEHLLLLGPPDPDDDDKRVNKLVRSYGFTTAQAETLVDLFDTAQRKADESAYTYGESTLVCAWENTAQEASCDPTAAHYYDHPDAVHHAVILAGTFTSLISQDEANQMAIDAAAAMLNCFYVSDAVQVSCEDLGYEEPVPNTDDGRKGTVVVPRGTFTSTISVEDATAQAMSYAKSLLVCYYINPKIELSCEDDNARNVGVTPTPSNKVEITLTPGSPRATGKGQVITIEPGVIRSNISTEAAIQEATLLAESLLECCFVNVAKVVTCPDYEYTYTDENGVKQTKSIKASREKSPQYSMSVEAGVFSSCVSQEEADHEAETFIQSALSCYYCNEVVLPTCVPDYVLQEVLDAIDRDDYSLLPLDPSKYDDVSQWSEDATVGAPPGYVCGFEYEQAQQIAETAARTIIHDLRSTESSKCRYTNDLLYAGCYFSDPFGNDSNVGGTKAVYYKAYAPGLGSIPYFVYKANVDRRLSKNVSTPTLGTYVAIPAGTISITINDVPASFKAPDVIETNPFDQLDPDNEDNATTEESLSMPGVKFNDEGEIESEAMRVKAYANELALKMAMGMVQCLYANPEMEITCYDVGKPGASSPDGTNAWTVPAELFVGPNYKVVIAEAKKLLESMVLCLYPNAPHTCSAGCNPCKFPLKNDVLTLNEDDVTYVGPQSISVSIPGGMFWAASREEANAQALVACALPAPSCEYTISAEVTATCNLTCKAAGIDISLTDDDMSWGLDFWREYCPGYIKGIFKDPCFHVIGSSSGNSNEQEVKVTVTAGASGTSCEDLLVSAMALCVVQCQAKAEYAFTNRHLVLRCPGFSSGYEIPAGTYRGNKKAVRELLRNLRRYYCGNVKINKVGRKGVNVSEVTEDDNAAGDENQTGNTRAAEGTQTDETSNTSINEERYAQLDGKQIIELAVDFKPEVYPGVRPDEDSNVAIYDTVEAYDENDPAEDNKQRSVYIAARDTTYTQGDGVTIEQVDNDPFKPVYKISVTGGGGVGSSVSMTATTAGSTNNTWDGAPVLAPLKISTTKTGTYSVDVPQTGNEFYLSATRQEFYAGDCIEIRRILRRDVGPDQYERYAFSVLTGSGLEKVDIAELVGYIGEAENAIRVKADPNSPIKVTSDGVGLRYDDTWFKVENGVLTLDTAELDDYITEKLESIVADAVAEASSDIIRNSVAAISISGDIISGDGTSQSLIYNTTSNTALSLNDEGVIDIQTTTRLS